MRPHVVELESHVLDLVPVGAELAVLGRGSVRFFDAELRTVATSPDPRDGIVPMRLLVLADGRLLAADSLDSGKLAVVKRGEPLAAVAIADDTQLQGFVVTELGFFAWTRTRLLADVGGDQRVFEVGGYSSGASWGERVVLAGAETLQVVGIDGTPQTMIARVANGKPVAFGTHLAVPTREGTVVYDTELVEITTLAGTPLFAWGDGLVLLADERIVYATAAGLVWHLRGDFAYAAGDRLVVGESAVPKAWICERTAGAGGEPVEIPLTGTLDGACAFGGGVALIDRTSSAAHWWRPGTEVVALEHDFTPARLVATPTGIATSEANVIYTWSTEADGPDVGAAADGPPLDTAIVAEGVLVTLEARGRFASRGKNPEGRLVRIPNHAAWRPAITRDDARPLLEQLLQRVTDGTVPAIEKVTPALAQRPLRETAALHAKALFARTTLSDDAAATAESTRRGFFEELGGAFGVSHRVMLASVRARKFPLLPPRVLAGYEYLGSFATDGDLVVCDPCYFGQRSQRGVYSLTIRAAGHDGLWHFFVQPGVGEYAGRTAELVAIHSEGFQLPATEPIGTIGVDAGHVGVFDRGCPKPQGWYDEGIFVGQGAIASSGLGDGGYPVFAGSLRRKVAKLRVHFIGGSPDVDGTIAKTTGVKKYSAKERYDVGESLEHPTFGRGTVVRLADGGKIEVAFGEDRRVLVHDRK